MKRMLFLLLACLVLCGCNAVSHEETTLPETTQAPQTEPTGCYAPGSTLETETSGAVQAYPLNRQDVQGLLATEEGLLLFSGTAGTTLTKLTGEALYIDAVANLGCTISPESPSLQASRKGVTYFDSDRKDLVFLDTQLKEVRRYPLPDDLLGQPALSADRKTLYYCAPLAVRVIDLESGIDRLLKTLTDSWETIDALHCDGTVLECVAQDGSRIFISAQTGETLQSSPAGLVLTTASDRFFALNPDETYLEMLTGIKGESVRTLHYPNSNVVAWPVLNHACVLLVSLGEENTTIDYYDLDEGIHPYSLTLPDSERLRCVTGDGSSIWFIRYDSEFGCDTLCRWTPEMSPVTDDTVYIGIRRTRENPDEEGLAQCDQQANQIAEKWGVPISILPAQTPEGYTIESEYHVSVLKQTLEDLSVALAPYPDDMLKKAAASGAFDICLVRSIEDADGSSLPSLQYRDESGTTHIFLTPGWYLAQELNYQLYFPLESRILSTSSALDSWNKLNPKNFQYISDSALPEDYAKWFDENDDRAFVNSLSMTSPREDRAYLMEYAMMDDCEAIFQGAAMQKKLRQLCLGIRQAYGLTDSGDTFLWEQYLKEPLK